MLLFTPKEIHKQTERPIMSELHTRRSPIMPKIEEKDYLTIYLLKKNQPTGEKQSTSHFYSSEKTVVPSRKATVIDENCTTAMADGTQRLRQTRLGNNSDHK